MPKNYAVFYDDTTDTIWNNGPVQPVGGKNPWSETVPSIGHYVFSDPTTFGTDISGNGRNLSFTGSGDSAPVGEFGRSWNQESSTARYFLSDDAFRITGAMSIWGYVTAEGTGARGIAGCAENGEASSDNFLWVLSLDGNGIGYFHESGGGVNVPYVTPSLGINTGDLVWVGWTRDSAGTGLTFYMNGVAVDTTTLGSAPTDGSASRLYLVNSFNASTGNTPGQIHAVKIFNTELTATQMKREYENCAGLSLDY